MINKHLYLSPEAVFPITYDENGDAVNNKPLTGFSIAGTIQGEGKMAGVPVLFLRTSRCNLRCMWSLPNGELSLCDTPYASFNTNDEKHYPIEKIKNVILKNLGKINHLVISGGEPFLQSENLYLLIKKLEETKKLHYSIETNGTIYNDTLAEKIDFFSISPKLKNSVPTQAKLEKLSLSVPFDSEYIEKMRLNLTAIQSIIDHCKKHPGKDFQLKFVVQSLNELIEIEESFLSKLKGWKPDDIVLMPLGSTPEELKQTRMIAVEAAIERGWRFSPRLQINYFGGIAGV